MLWEKLEKFGIRGDFLSSLKALYKDDCVDCLVNGVSTKPVYLRRGLRQGCPCSPMLFALYIADVGNDIMLSQLGFLIGTTVVSGLLSADDLVVLARSEQGLEHLLQIVKTGFDRLKLTINVSKSKIISPSDKESWDILDDDDNVVMTLDMVDLYKYLGTWTYHSMFKTSTEKQRHCIKTAYKYKGNCMQVAKDGPDTAEVIVCTWTNVAVNEILAGCEMVPFTETTIETIESVQSQVAKFALGLAENAPNICTQTELGIKPFRQVLYERQLKYYFRLLFIDEARWAHQALMDHLSGNWSSPYIDYISNIRLKLNISFAISNPNTVKSIVSDYFLADLNEKITRFGCLLPISCLKKQQYVSESPLSSVISQ